MIEGIIAIVAFAAGAVIVGIVVHFRAKSQTVAAETTAKNLRDQDVVRESVLTRVREDLAGEQRARVAAETQLAAAQSSFDEQRATLDRAKKDLTDAFEALAAKALKGNREEFADLANERVDKLIAPLKEALARYEKEIGEIESRRVGAYSGLTEQLQGLARAQKSLEQQTTTLAQALKAPTVRGKWGEVVLEQVLHLSGLPQECVEPQPSVAGEEGTQRPDLVVRFPGGRCIVIDSKVPLESYLAATETQDADVRRDKLAAHSVAARQHVRALSNKAYWDRFPTADFVVLFMPAESMLSAATADAPGLMAEAMENRVILTTPTTLIALLLTVAHTWRQFRLAEGARKIADAGTELYDRLTTFAEYLGSIRSGLDKASDAYNKAVGSWERRVEPAARRLKELGAAKPDQELPELKGIDGALRQLPPAAEPETPGKTD